MHRIAPFLGRLRFGEPIACENLVVVPVYGPESGPRVVALAEALRRDAADVKEAGERGKVNAVRVTNRSIDYLLLFGGEEIAGGKQDRIVNATVVVGPGETIEVPVSCVERGRWKGELGGFRAARRAVPPSMRGRNAGTLTTTLCLSGVWDVGQSRVWGDVERMARRRNAVSETRAFAAVAERDGDAVEDFVVRIRPLPGQTGLAAYVSGRFVSLDVFGQAEVYAQVHDMIVRSCAMEAIDRSEEPCAQSRVLPTAVIDDLLETHVIDLRSPGHGTDARLEHPCVTGSALLTLEGVVHLSAFSVV